MSDTPPFPSSYVPCYGVCKRKLTDCDFQVIFFIILGEVAPHCATGLGGSGPVEAASVLSFGAAIAGFALGWTSLAADYTVNFPVETPNWKVFIYTYVGVVVPMIFIEILGAATMAALVNKTTWADAYAADGLGGLLGAPLTPLGGFGKFLLVLLALSIVANNIPNMYSELELPFLLWRFLLTFLPQALPSPSRCSDLWLKLSPVCSSSSSALSSMSSSPSSVLTTLRSGLTPSWSFCPTG